MQSNVNRQILFMGLYLLCLFTAPRFFTVFLNGIDVNIWMTFFLFGIGILQDMMPLVIIMLIPALLRSRAALCLLGLYTSLCFWFYICNTTTYRLSRMVLSYDFYLQTASSLQQFLAATTGIHPGLVIFGCMLVFAMSWVGHTKAYEKSVTAFIQKKYARMCLVFLLIPICIQVDTLI